MAFTLIPPGQRKGNKSYLARGRISGRIEERTLHTTDEKVARRRVRELEATLLAAQPGDRVTFAQAAQRYVEFRDPSRNDRQRIARLVDDIGARFVRDLRAADIHDAANRIAGHHLPATRNREVVRPAVTILHHAADAGLCDWLRVRAFREPRPVTRALDPASASALIGAAAPGFQRLLLVWLFFQGTRISDTLRVQWEDIDMRREIVVVPISKTGRTETFPLHPATLHELTAINDRTGAVFPWTNRSSLRRWLPALAASVGVEFTAHMARHTLGAMMAANGETLRAIMAALGHSQASSSLRYQAADIEMVRAATGRVQLPHTKIVGNVA